MRMQTCECECMEVLCVCEMSAHIHAHRSIFGTDTNQPGEGGLTQQLNTILCPSGPFLKEAESRGFGCMGHDSFFWSNC